MTKGLLLSFCVLFGCSGVALADGDPVQDAIHKKFGALGSVVAKSRTSTSPVTYYFRMSAPLTFPGSEYHVIFPITCTQLTDSAPNFFCSATIPSGAGVPPSFPPAFIVPNEPQ